MAKNESGVDFQAQAEELAGILTGDKIDKVAALERFSGLYGDGGSGEDAYASASEKRRPEVMNEVWRLGRQAIDYLFAADDADKLTPPLSKDEKVRLVAKHAVLVRLMDGETEAESKKATPTQAIKTDHKK